MRRVQILYVSSSPSQRCFDAMGAERRTGPDGFLYGMDEAAYKFHSLIRDGLSSDDDVEVTAISGRSVTESSHARRWWPSVSDRIRPGLTIQHPGFVNVKGLRQLFIAAGTFARILRWRAATKGAQTRILVVDAAYVTLLPFIMAALARSDVKRTAIFADIYVYMAPASDASDRSGRAIDLTRRVAMSCYRRLDGFILLTEAMNEVVNPKGRPYLIMEGVADDSGIVPDVVRAEKPTALYAGALRKEYGLENLVRGFQKYDNPNARLVILGAGDYGPAIQQASIEDPRIDFRGRAPLPDVLAAEREAWLLVNPRPSGEAFTRFSFPSKVMEYLGSGTAAASTRLPGIPEEYFEYLLEVEPGEEGITKVLEEAFARPLNSLEEQGAKGRKFVVEGKGKCGQAQRIVAFAGQL